MARRPLQAGVRAQRGEAGAGVGVVGRDRLGELQRVAAIGAGGVIAQHGARRLVLVVDLRHADHVAVPRHQRREPADRVGHLVDLGEEEHAGEAARILARDSRAEEVQAHRARARHRHVERLVGVDDHGAPPASPGPGMNPIEDRGSSGRRGRNPSRLWLRQITGRKFQGGLRAVRRWPGAGRAGALASGVAGTEVLPQTIIRNRPDTPRAPAAPGVPFAFGRANRSARTLRPARWRRR